MKILLLGTDNFTASALYTIVKNEYSVCGVITHKHAKHTQRLSDLAARLGIPYYIVDNINSENTRVLVENLSPDVIFSIHFDRIIKPEIFKLAKICAINLHPSILPKYRGMSPFQSVLRYNEKETAISIHHIVEKVDEGNIIAQKILSLNDNMYLSDLQILMMKNYPEVILEALEKIKNNNYQGIEQSKENSSYYGKIQPEDYIINDNDSVEEAYSKIRAFSYPDKGAQFNGFHIWKVDDIIMDKSKLVENKDDDMVIQLSNGMLYIKKGNYSPVDDVIRGGELTVLYDKFYILLQLYKDIQKKIKIESSNDYTIEKTLYYEDTMMMIYKNAVFLQVDYGSYNKLYYYTQCHIDFIEGLNLINNNCPVPNILEIVSKNKQNNLQYIINNTLFRYYGGLIRMVKKIEANDISHISEKISYAEASNIDDIIAVHSDIFNKYIDREIKKTELESKIINKEIYIYKRHNDILGCLIYSKKGKIYHLQYWFTNKNKINGQKGVGKTLMEALYNTAGVGNFIEVWCRKDNVSVIDIYNKYGFRKDGMESDVLVYCQNSEAVIPLKQLNYVNVNNRSKKINLIERNTGGGDFRK